MSDDLLLPTVPEAEPDDPEDVSWALSTAEAMWARGDHSEGIKWIRRAAEAASETENDARALALAKAAADLTGLIAQRASRASIDLEEVDPISEPSPPARPAGAKPPPKPAGSIAPRPLPTSVTRQQLATPSRPPAPLPSRTSQPPAGGVRPSTAPAANKPAGAPYIASPRPAAGKGPDSSKTSGPKKSRRSRENLEAEARAASPATETARLHPIDESRAHEFLPSDTAETAAIEVPMRRSRSELDPTIASHVHDLVKPTSRTTDEWDASPTQNISGDDLPFMMDDGDRKTAIAGPPTDFKATVHGLPRPAATKPPDAGAARGSGTNPPATVVGAMLAHTSASASPSTGTQGATGIGERHDPGIVTSQAVRVVVWRDANGVHVAPAGTVVSAITVDAVLVALEPNADLTAWLSAHEKTQGSAKRQ